MMNSLSNPLFMWFLWRQLLSIDTYCLVKDRPRPADRMTQKRSMGRVKLQMFHNVLGQRSFCAACCKPNEASNAWTGVGNSENSTCRSMFDHELAECQNDIHSSRLPLTAAWIKVTYRHEAMMSVEGWMMSSRLFASTPGCIFVLKRNV